MKNKYLFYAMMIVFCLFILPSVADAQPETPDVQYEKGIVLSVQPIDQDSSSKMKFGKQELIKLQITSGVDTDQEITIVNYQPERSAFGVMELHEGDHLILEAVNQMGKLEYHISDFQRDNYIYLLIGLFVFCLLIFGRAIGFKSILVIGCSCFLIVAVFINQILKENHWEIGFMVFLLCTIISIISQTLISGWNKKTFAAILGTLGGVAIAGILAKISIYLMHLNGLANEEAIMLKATALPNVDFQGILFAGMVIGALGAVMDVAISISSSIHEVKQHSNEIHFKPLFKAGMNIGRDVMGTMSNTLILAYVGSSLPLILLLSVQKDLSLIKIMNFNLIATEIVRALTGSIGLVCAIPLTACISAYLFCDKRKSSRKKRIVNS
ncbi:YibE/F family protein [Propionispira raffinosivorans]|uniref:YibE/F family protein n=1 Tax=Propionispira raffinosivorans TaxID=86959 RepID=UPI00036A5C58|nr:YibE/F family protein [Propionispira raffinosivorans]